METKTKLRNWGSSIGVVIPSEVIKKENFHTGEEVIIEIRKKKSIKEAFGSMRGWKIDSQKVKDDLRKEWSKW